MGPERPVLRPAFELSLPEQASGPPRGTPFPAPQALGTQGHGARRAPLHPLPRSEAEEVMASRAPSPPSPQGCSSHGPAPGCPVALWFPGVPSWSEKGGGHKKAVLHLPLPLSGWFLGILLGFPGQWGGKPQGGQGLGVHGLMRATCKWELRCHLERPLRGKTKA